MMAGMMRPPELPPAIQARINRIIDSELLGMVVHPQPLTLVGIAGNQAILRTPTGQTGWVKEGDELGGVKLVGIGVNRVLVEDQGVKKELMIFSGFGGDSLLSKQDTSHEIEQNNRCARAFQAPRSHWGSLSCCWRAPRPSAWRHKCFAKLMDR